MNSNSHIQAVLFKKNSDLSSNQRLNIIRNHMHLEPIKRVHETKKYYRYRITEPIEGAKKRIKRVNDDIDLIIEFI